MSSSDRFANAAFAQATNYDRRFSKYAPFSDIIETLRREVAFDVPLKFVLDKDSESAGFFKRGPQWDFGNAGVRFEKKEEESGKPVLVVSWSDEFEQKTLQETLDELRGLGFGEDADITLELVSPTGDRMFSRFGNRLKTEKRDRSVIHFTGSWQKGND